MLIQKKILAIIFVTLGILFSSLFLVIRHITIEGHLNIENNLVEQNIKRVQESINGLVEQLGIKSSDWGNWDDTYKFIEDHNKDYISSNLEDTSLKNMKINFMLFIDNDQKIVKAKSISETTWTDVTPTQDILHLAKPESQLLQSPEHTFEKGGLILLDQKPAVIFTRPILTSELKGPSRGTLIWGYFITPQIIDDIEKKTHLTISFDRWDLTKDMSHNDIGQPHKRIEVLGDDHIEGYSTINDIYGNKTFYIEVLQDRPVYQEGIKNTHYLGLVLIASMALVSVLLFILLDRIIISRMMYIHKDLKKISQAQNMYLRVRSLGKDEIGNLSDEINKTLEALEKSHSSLETTRNQLIQSQKLESLGKLAGGIAHDFNNILGSVLGYASLLQSKFANDASISKKLSVIVQSAERGAHLTKQLLGFARQGKYEKAVFSINDVIDECLELIKSSTKNITIEKILDPQTLPLEGDSTQILQVILNLGLNAKDAMPDGGKLYFGTQNTDLDELTLKSLGAPVDMKKGKYVHLTVRDTGTGIPKDIQGKIFDPFFTTKSHGKGSGLGLATVHGIVENHQGWITLNSEEGRGTTFHIFFPVSTKPSTAIPTVKAETNTFDLSIIENKTILITDDEKNLRDYVSDILTSHKAHIVSAENGKDGAEKFHQYQVDLVILDIIMPQYDGFYAYEEIHKDNPDTPILFVSGYSEDNKVAALRANSNGKVFFVQKPYKPEKLLSTIAAALRKERKDHEAAH